MYPCTVSADLGRYEREQDRRELIAERQEREIEEMADDMLLSGGEWYPYSANMFIEMIGECDQSMYDRLHIVMKMMEKGEDEYAAKMLRLMMESYCKSGAVRQVKREKFYE